MSAGRGRELRTMIALAALALALALLLAALVLGGSDGVDMAPGPGHPLRAGA